MTLNKQVERTLEDFPETRNSDIALTIQIWETYYPEYLENGWVKIENLYDLPREDNVKRIRARIQNVEGRLLPTSEAVVKQRRINEDRWRDAMGYALEEPLSGAIQQTLN